MGVEDTTGVQFDDDKDEDRAKEQVVDHGEVTGPDVLGVVLQEGAPGLTAGGRWPELVQVLLDGAFADVDPEFEQFTVNAFGTPQPVLLRHLFDEINDFLGDTRFALLQTPIESTISIKTLIFQRPNSTCTTGTFQYQAR